MEHIEQTKELRKNGRVTHSSEVIEERNSTREKVHTQTVIINVIWYVAGVLLVVLGLRFIFALSGADASNGFVNFIYTISHPFVAPFFGIFSYHLKYGVSRFEAYTLVAMIVYGLIALAIARLVAIDHPRNLED